MSKKITISLGDKDFVLHLEGGYFYKFFKEVTGVDLYATSFEVALKVSERDKQIKSAKDSGQPIPEENGYSITETRLYKMISTTEHFLYASGIVYAGYAAHKSINRENIDLDFKEIEHLINCLSEGEVSDIVNKYNEARMQPAGEV